MAAGIAIVVTFLLIASFAESIIGFRGPLIDALARSGATVHIAAPGLGSQSPVRKELESRGAVVHEIPLRRTGTNPVGDLRLLLSLVFLMRRIRPHVVMGYTVKPVIYGSIAGWLVGVRHRFALVTGLGYAFTSNRRGPLTSLVRRLYAFGLGKTHKVFFQNPDDEEVFRRIEILPPRIPSVVVNGSGVDVESHQASPVLPGPQRFLMIGRLLGDKGVREFANAARLIRVRHPDVAFSLVGWIDDNPDAIGQSELDAWIGEGLIEFLGRLEDVRPAIAACSVYVLPSYREGTPRTVLEAMAMGRAAITTDAPGCRETVVDGVNGFLVPVKSVEGLAAAMQRFIEDPSLAASMGARSREIAVEKYDVRKVTAVLIREMEIA